KIGPIRWRLRGATWPRSKGSQSKVLKIRKVNRCGGRIIYLCLAILELYPLHDLKKNQNFIPCARDFYPSSDLSYLAFSSPLPEWHSRVPTTHCLWAAWWSAPTPFP